MTTTDALRPELFELAQTLLTTNSCLHDTQETLRVTRQKLKEADQEIKNLMLVEASLREQIKHEGSKGKETTP